MDQRSSLCSSILYTFGESHMPQHQGVDSGQLQVLRNSSTKTTLFIWSRRCDFDPVFTLNTSISLRKHGHKTCVLLAWCPTHHSNRHNNLGRDASASIAVIIAVVDNVTFPCQHSIAHFQTITATESTWHQKIRQKQRKIWLRRPRCLHCHHRRAQGVGG